MKQDVDELLRLMGTLRKRRPMPEAMTSSKLGELTHAQGQALMTLGMDGPMPIGALAELVGCSVSACTGLVDRLERIDLVKRGAKPGDRRVVLVELTEEGQQITATMLSVIRKDMSEFLDLLSDRDRKSFLRIFRTLVAKVESLS